MIERKPEDIKDDSDTVHDEFHCISAIYSGSEWSATEAFKKMIDKAKLWADDFLDN